MNLLKFSFLALFAIALFGACNQKNANQTQDKPEEPVTDKPVVEEPATEKPAEEVYQLIGFQKTACFGKCPVYEVKFYSNNTATWHGRMNVEREGWHEAKLEGKVIGDIQKKADALGYWDFYERYPMENKVVDLPSTITYVRVGDMIKTVNNTHEAPKELEEFENYVSEVIEGLDWRPATNRD